MHFYFAGGAMEVGGSCIYVRIADKGILMDAGIRQGGSREPLPDFRGIQERGGVDLILISHAHMDHTGSLPVISKAYPQARIYMTRMAMDQTRVLLFDSLKLMDRREEEIPAYSREDVFAMLERIVPIPFQQETLLPFPDMRLTAYPAGHIAGAALLYLKTPEGSILYTGDVSGFAQQTIEGLGIPRLRPDVLIMESTYGDRLHASRTLEEERLITAVADCAQKGMKVLIPAFALGRSQEVLLLLRSAMQKGKIPRIPVYVDGMVRDMTRVYAANPLFLRKPLARRILKGEDPFYTDEIRPVAPMEDRNVLMNTPGPAVFVSSSGMLTGGPSVLYARVLLPRKDACVILTGYQDEEAPGRLLMNLLDQGQTEEARVSLDGTMVPVAARVIMVGLSAHADQTELCGIADRVSARRIILVHGDPSAIRTLGDQLSADFRRQVFQPSPGEELEILLRSRRAQQEDLTDHMNCSGFDSNEDCFRLWDFVRTHYPRRGLAAVQLAWIWSGRRDWADQDLQAFQDLLLGSGFFDRHPKRLYLLMAQEEEMVHKAMRKKEAAPQDVEERIRALAAEGEGPGLPIRKLSFYPAEKKVLLTADFPDVVDRQRFGAVRSALLEDLDWTLELKDTMNHSQAEALLRSLFPGRIRKISIYADKKTYQVSLTGYSAGDEEASETFRRETGWTLSFPGSPSAAGPSPKGTEAGAPVKEDPSWFLPEDTAPVDQNLAFSLIDGFFEDSPVKPYKKGKKTDHLGGYLDLSFVSPALGMRCADILRETALRTGWRIHVSDSVNQQQVQQTAVELCAARGILLRKNPSYLPLYRGVRLVTMPETPLTDDLKKAFEDRTGLPVLDS